MSETVDASAGSSAVDGPALARVLLPLPPQKPSALRRLAILEALLPTKADGILLGDSLAAAWPADLLTAVWPGARLLNLGLPGDRIGQTLWRLNRLRAGYLRPRVLAVLLGINNLGDGDPPDAIAAGLIAVVADARRLWPGAEPLLFTIPRRGSRPGAHEVARQDANRQLRLMASAAGFRLLETDSALGEEDGDASRESDGLHLSRHGYELLTAALREALRAP